LEQGVPAVELKAHLTKAVVVVSVACNRKVILGSTILIVLIALTGLYAGGFLPTTKPITPLNYGLTLEPTNATILQGQTFNATLTASYLEGTPEDVTLTVDAPEGFNCTLSDAVGKPTSHASFNSTLQVTVASTIQPGNYWVTVTSNSTKGRENATSLDLLVLTSFINVSGTVTAALDDRMWPVAVTFENVKTHEKITTSVWTTPATGIPEKLYGCIIHTGDYSLLLPNQAEYHVTVDWARFLMFGGTGDASGSFSADNLTVNCGVGVDSLVDNSYVVKDPYFNPLKSSTHFVW
jgi:hypothetical protein